MLPEQQRFLNIGKHSVFIFFGIAPGPPRRTRRVRRPDRALRVAKLRTNRWSSRADRIDRSPCGGNVRCRTATALVPKTYDLWQSDVTCHVLTWFMTGARPTTRPPARSSDHPTVRSPAPPFGRHIPSTVTFSSYRVPNTKNSFIFANGLILQTFKNINEKTNFIFIVLFFFLRFKLSFYVGLKGYPSVDCVFRAELYSHSCIPNSDNSNQWRVIV